MTAAAQTRQTMAQRVARVDGLWRRYIAASRRGHRSAAALRRRWERAE